MRIDKTPMLITLLATVGIIAAVQTCMAAAPTVTNITAVQRGGRQPVDIYYDLADADGDPCAISVDVSTNSGATYGITATHFTGDVGHDVITGMHRHIVWDTTADFGTNFFCTRMRIRVTANDILYMVIDVAGGPNAAWYPVTYQTNAPPYTDAYKSTKIVLRRVTAGTFTMGSPMDELGRNLDETEHLVTLSSNFCIGVFEITQAQYSNVMGGINPSIYPGDTRPVERVSWNNVRGGLWPDGTPDVLAFMGRLQRKTGLAFDLPTEAQWEYACRAGTTGSWNNGTTITNTFADGNLDNLGHYLANGGWSSNHVAVGSFTPNGWGLYDMHANASEWCLDCIGSYPGGPETNPVGAAASPVHVVRGGGWDSTVRDCRSAARTAAFCDDMRISTGFRLALHGESGARRPFIAITNAPVTVSHTMTNYAVAGTCAWYVVGQMWVSNATVGGVASNFPAPANGKWTAPRIALSVGPNLIRVYGSNAFDTIEYGEAAVTRDGVFVVIDVSGGPAAEAYPISYVTNTPPLDDEYKTTKILLRKVEAGTFTMGSPTNELGRNDDETEHLVTLSSNFCIGVFEITQAQYSNVMGVINPSQYQGDTLPVERVSWNNVRGGLWPDGLPARDSFIEKLQSKTDFTFDLPTEAQWEYACRAGTTGSWNNGTTITNTFADGNLDNLGHYMANGGWSSNHVAVGSFTPNGWGLYDMHANASEWCLDCIGSYPGGPETNPVGAAASPIHVIRGGGWDNFSKDCRSALRTANFRDNMSGSLGFRLALHGDSGERRPSITITNAPVTLPHTTTNFVATGINNMWVVGRMWVSNATMGGAALSFPVPGNGRWTAPAIALADGANLIRVYGSNAFNVVKYGAATVTRDGVFVVIDVSGGPGASTYPVAHVTNTPVLSDVYKTTRIILRKIVAGTFTMGSPTNELGYDPVETEHLVTLSSNFYMGVFEITQAQYTNVMGGSYPGTLPGDTRPVDGVSWNMLRGGLWPGGDPSNETFVGVLRARTGLAFDLPTEAQWEYACRAVTTGSWNNGTTITNVYTDGNLARLGHYIANGGWASNHVAVGSFKPNGWGLYDMHANVSEWCLDSIGLYPGGPETDPVGSAAGPYHAIRGGGWDSIAKECRSAMRNADTMDTVSGSRGLRLALPADN